MSDIVAEFLKRTDKAQDVNRLVHEMQSEIDRLRQDLEQKNLTDAEREAVEYIELMLRCERHPVCSRHVDTLRSMLRRLR